MFNQYSRNEDKLRKDIEDFLDYIDGEIEDYDFNYRGEISSSIRDGKWTKQETQTKLENIITDYKSLKIDLDRPARAVL